MENALRSVADRLGYLAYTFAVRGRPDWSLVFGPDGIERELERPGSPEAEAPGVFGEPRRVGVGGEQEGAATGY